MCMAFLCGYFIVYVWFSLWLFYVQHIFLSTLHIFLSTLHIFLPWSFFGLFLLLMVVYSLVLFFLFFLDPKKNQNKNQITCSQHLTTWPNAQDKFMCGVELCAFSSADASHRMDCLCHAWAPGAICILCIFLLRYRGKNRICKLHHMGLALRKLYTLSCERKIVSR